MSHRGPPRCDQPVQMFWLAVRADGMGTDGDAVGRAPGDAVGEVPPWLAEAAGVAEGAATLADGLALADRLAGALKSDRLAGTSSWKDWKIAPSWGCVHSTLAVSDGTTCDRG